MSAGLKRQFARHGKRMATIWRLILCIIPLALTPLLALLIAEGHLNFGGGEKDLLLLIPWIIWSLIYAIIFIILWAKRKNLKNIVYLAAGGSTGMMILIWIGLYIFSIAELGIK